MASLPHWTAPSWATTNHMNFTKGKCWALHWDWASLAVCDCRGLREVLLGCWGMASWVRGVLAAMGQPCPGEPGKGGWIVLLCSDLGGPHLECWGRLGHHKVRQEVSERVQRRPWGLWKVWRGNTFHVGSSWGHLICSAWGHWGDLTVCNLPVRGRGGADPDLFTLVTGDSTQRNSQSWVRTGFGWTPGKFFTQRTVEHWSRVPRKWSQHQAWQECNKGLDNTLGQMLGILGMTRTKELDSMIPGGLFQLSTFYDSLHVHLWNKHRACS